MRPALNIVVLSNGLQAETRALLDAMTVKPNATRAHQIDRTIRSLKASGLWTKLDVLYMLAAHDEQAGRLNWKAPGTYTLTQSATPTTFTTDQGFMGNGVSSYLNSTLNLSTLGGQFAQDSAVMGVYVHAANSVASANDITIGTTARLSANAGVTGYGVRLNDGSANLNIAAPAVGHFAGRRTVSTGKEGWKSGALLAGPDAVASTGVGNTFFLLAASAAAGFSNARLSFAYAGGAPDAPGMASLHTSLLAYLQAVGAA